MKKTASIIIILLILSVILPAQTKAEQISEVIEYYFDAGVLNGTILVADKGEIIYHNAVGVSNMEKEELTIEHNFRLASVSKTFTSIAVLMLMEDGKLKLDDLVSSYLSDFPYKNVTIEHLLTHTSGLPSYSKLLDKRWDITHIDSPERQIASNKGAYKLLLEHQPAQLFHPGDEYKYSNSGYMILALLVEEISGLSFQEFMKVYIFDPLEMTSTYINSTDGNNPIITRAFTLKQDL